jgi:hypothetical protein
VINVQGLANLRNQLAKRQLGPCIAPRVERIPKDAPNKLLNIAISSRLDLGGIPRQRARIMQQEFTRKEIYDLVWSQPVRTIAAGMGISDVGLVKDLKKANIPRASARLLGT